MNYGFRFVWVWIILSSWISVTAADSRVIEFDRDVRPILSAHCFQCHGPDEKTREAGLRLDTRAGLFGSIKNGTRIVAPKSPEQSELYHRITSKDSANQMPPTELGKPLTANQIEILRLWIEQGGAWRGHWSYEPLQRPPVPVATQIEDENPIDAFLRKRWEIAGAKPVKSADANTLMRRLNFDLTGLPPVDLLKDDEQTWTNPESYPRKVEQLLASARYGERMAVYWLDLVRYADSCGYHSDVDQRISPYRDYVIHAFNDNIPFDQFTREQLAGDLLPEPTLRQRIATGFNRLNKSTEEGGAQEGEYLAKAFADRVRTVSGTWLAVTFGCAECHDHKYDPLTARDFYSLGAFFADIKERGVYSGNGKHDPEIGLPTPDQARRIEQLDAELVRLHARVDAGTSDPAAKNEIDNEIKLVEQHKKNLDRQISTTMVTVSVKPREIRILPRGDWLNQSGDLVEPAVPAIFEKMNSPERRLTRLDLADWLTHRDNPLTARVFVNRLWKLFFGWGLARNLDDLGLQGEAPTHPDLLDWLAAEFVDSGWDVKHMVRLMVTSRAYRLSSVPSQALVELDPQNRLFARQSRWRLEAEFLRDNALTVSGLLVERIGGPSVKPYQPEGYWEFLNFPKRTWQNSTGADQYRRGLYTHWQRTFLHPALLAFDAPSREECTASRASSNTPKSALALLNSPTFVEAARVFAERILREGGTRDRSRITWSWQTALCRSPDEREIEALSGLLATNRNQYRTALTAAAGLLDVGQFPLGAQIENDELAAWTAVARAILNLHEFTTRN